MIENILKGFALFAFASIAIGTVKWLVRRPVALLLMAVALSLTACLMR